MSYMKKSTDTGKERASYRSNKSDCLNNQNGEPRSSDKEQGVGRSTKTKQNKSSEGKIKLTPEPLSPTEEIPNLSTTDLASEKCPSSQSEEEEEPLKIAFDKYKEHYDSLPLKTLFDEIMKRGICPNEDERLAIVRESLAQIYKDRKLTDIVLNYELFKKISEPVSTLLLKILNGNLAIQNIDEWNRCLFIYYETIKEMTGNNLEISITSTDGQRLRWGPKRNKFPLNELSHTIIYLLTAENTGFSLLHEIIGLDVKPTSEYEPSNPLIGGGALAMASQLVNCAFADKTSSERHEQVRQLVAELTGGAPVLFDSKAFVSSEKKSEYFKSVLSWMKRKEGANILCKNVDKVAQFYLESSSLQIDCDALSVLGATLANGGIGATTGRKIFCSECVEKVLSIMTISSGRPGVPVVVSSSGAVMVLVPAVLGIAVYSEDPSAIGFFLSALFRHFALNPYERKFLQIGREKEVQSCMKSALFASARSGDVMTLSSLIDAGAVLGALDYMKRTALHVSAARGHLVYTRLLLNYCPRMVAVKDIAGRTPLDEARSFDRKEIVTILESWELASLGPPTSNKSISTH